MGSMDQLFVSRESNQSSIACTYCGCGAKLTLQFLSIHASTLATQKDGKQQAFTYTIVKA